jgi:hypothetical protein
MDFKARELWVEYSRAKDLMLEHTDIPEAKWRQIEGDDKRRARLNGIRSILNQVDYTEIPSKKVILPELEIDESFDRPSRDSHIVVKDYYENVTGIEDIEA